MIVIDKQNELSQLGTVLKRQDLTIEELVSVSDDLLAELVPKQSRYKVTERPDVRTIRYYISQGLLPKPVSYKGGRARYAGTHLIRLLLIKKLQAEHHTLQKISGLLKGATDRQVLEGLDEKETSLSRVRPQKTKVSHSLPGGCASARIHRISLPFANIDIPETVLQSQSQRFELADQLEAMAKNLRLEGSLTAHEEGEDV